MPAKNFSAVQRLAHSLYAPPRYFSGRSLVSKNVDALGIHNRMTHERAWPQREETYAAIQLMRQNRNWSNIRKLGLAISPNFSMARRGITPRRNNILTAKNASAKRIASKPHEVEFAKKRSIDNQKKSTGHQMQQFRSLGRGSSKKGRNSKQEDQEDMNEKEPVEVRSVRDVVFGIQENNDDDKDQQRLEDNDLLKRLTTTRPYSVNSKLSKKVIAPYQTYKSHRNCWAEFRHRLVYGGANYF